jgi:hypothetical protein
VNEAEVFVESSRAQVVQMAEILYGSLPNHVKAFNASINTSYREPWLGG